MREQVKVNGGWRDLYEVGRKAVVIITNVGRLLSVPKWAVEGARLA